MTAQAELAVLDCVDDVRYVVMRLVRLMFQAVFELTMIYTLIVGLWMTLVGTIMTFYWLALGKPGEPLPARVWSPAGGQTAAEMLRQLRAGTAHGFWNWSSLIVEFNSEHY